jgi:magnesium transporter
VLSFQQRPGDVWEPVRQRIRQGLGRVRQRGADFLLHALMDAVVDAYFGVLVALDARVIEVEADALDPRRADLLERVAAVKADVDLLRAAVWPQRDAVSTLIRGEGQLIEGRTLPFFRDLADHVANLVEQVDGQRDRLRSAIDLHLAMTSRQLNDVMKVLTLVSTVFMPLTFIVGVYGMNFEDMPELHWKFGYPLVMGVMVAVVVGMVAFFRRRGWV